MIGETDHCGDPRTQKIVMWAVVILSTHDSHVLANLNGLTDNEGVGEIHERRFGCTKTNLLYSDTYVP